MAKTDKKTATATAAEGTKKEKKVRVPKDKNPENFSVLNSTVEGKNKTVTRQLHVRGFGVFLETTTYANEVPTAVSTTWVSGLKPKSKKEAKFLVIDKGPKPKKSKEEKEASKEKKAKK